MSVEKSLLQSLIDCVEKNTSAHVCIHDVSGILQNDILQIKKSNQIHFTPLCNAAKTTDKGLQLCLACKGLSVKKAFDGGHAYSGICPLGLTEIVVPLIISGEPMCIIYIGNLNCDSDEIKNEFRGSISLLRQTVLCFCSLYHQKCHCPKLSILLEQLI
jgi:hypothetical protein